jgi:hypothetical protein
MPGPMYLGSESIDRLMADMTPDQYKRAINKLGLSQVRAARFLGVSDRHGQHGNGPVRDSAERLASVEADAAL